MGNSDVKTTPSRGILLKKFGLFSVIYLVISLAVLTSEYFFRVYPVFYYFLKPLIVVSLMAYYLYISRARGGMFDLMMLMALLFSLAGDILLMFSGETWFIAGVGAFLIAQLCYISLFGLTARSTPQHVRRVLVRKPWLIIPFVLYGAVLVGYIFPSLEALLIPVLVYSTALVMMVLAAANRWKFTSYKSFALVFAGAVLFMLSDSMIAVGRFGKMELPDLLVRFWIMGTYMAAQFLIVWGILIERKTPKPQVLGMN
ncbi:MAG: lysoplasmalogenase [Bacteroidia bacterium]